MVLRRGDVPVDENIEVLASIVTKLDAAGIPYMLTGSGAMFVYGIPRMTRDVDIVIECAVSDAQRLAELFKDDWFVDEVGVRNAIRDRRSFNVIHKERFFKVDMIVRKDKEFQRHEFDRRTRKRIGELDVWIAGAEDLILSKLMWSASGNSAQQLHDAKQMAKVIAELDWDYLGTWADKLGLRDLLLEIKPDA